jgi:hypothetical protein
MEQKKIGDLVTYDCRCGDIISFAEEDKGHWLIYNTWPDGATVVPVGASDIDEENKRTYVLYSVLSNLGARYEYCRPKAKLPTCPGLV